MDQTCIQSTDFRGAGYAPVGDTPVVHVNGGKRHKFALMAAISSLGPLYWTPLSSALSADLLIRFFELILSKSNNVIFMLLDNLSVHHSKKVQAWLDGRKDRIRVFFLPPYCPQLNPIEWFNAHLKHYFRKTAVTRDAASLENTVYNYIANVKDLPCKLMAHFLKKYDCSFLWRR